MCFLSARALSALSLWRERRYHGDVGSRFLPGRMHVSEKSRRDHRPHRRRGRKIDVEITKVDKKKKIVSSPFSKRGTPDMHRLLSADPPPL